MQYWTSLKRNSSSTNSIFHCIGKRHLNRAFRLEQYGIAVFVGRILTILYSSLYANCLSRPYVLDKTFLNDKILVCSHCGGWVGMRLGREGVACWIPWHRKQSQFFCIAGEKFKKMMSHLLKLHPHPTLTSTSVKMCSRGCTEVWVWNSREEEELAIASMTQTSNWCWNCMKK